MCNPFRGFASLVQTNSWVRCLVTKDLSISFQSIHRVYFDSMWCEERRWQWLSECRYRVMGEYKSSVPYFVFHFPQITTCHIFIFFIILNFGYFLRKLKQIHNKLWLVEHKVEHKKWYNRFIFIMGPFEFLLCFFVHSIYAINDNL